MKRHFFLFSSISGSPLNQISLTWAFSICNVTRNFWNLNLTRRRISKKFSWKRSELGWWCKHLIEAALSTSARHWSSVEPKLNYEFSNATCLLLRTSSVIHFFSRKRPASAASKTNFSWNLLASARLQPYLSTCLSVYSHFEQKIRKASW